MAYKKLTLAEVKALGIPANRTYIQTTEKIIPHKKLKGFLTLAYKGKGGKNGQGS